MFILKKKYGVLLHRNNLMLSNYPDNLNCNKTTKVIQDPGTSAFH